MGARGAEDLRVPGATDYFTPVPPPRCAVPRAETSAPQPRRRPGLLLAALLLGLPAAAVSVARAHVAPVEPLTWIEAPADSGWSAGYVDDAGRPARWDPCTAIRYVVHPGWMPPEGRGDLAEALRRLSAASGLVFEDAGDTDELPRPDRAAYQPERYGERWAPLLVAWMPPGATDLGVGGGVQGVSMGVAVPSDRGGHLVSGQVVLDAGNRLSTGFGPGATEGEVLLHELAHAVGLGHVLDPTQVMYVRTTNSESEYGAGDRAGLAAVGAAAGCHPAPPPGSIAGGRS
jgi:hypothetical protein